MGYFLTADGGTESLRVRIYDVNGVCVASHAEPYQTTFLPGARAEQNPEDWWTSLCKASRASLAQAGLSGDKIEAMRLAGLVVSDSPAGLGETMLKAMGK